MAHDTATSPVAPFAVVTLQGTPQAPGHQVVLVNLLSRAVSLPVEVGLNPESLAITPDGKTAYVPGFSSADVTPVDITTWRAGKPIALPGTSPRAIAISPDGAMAYVLDAQNATVIPITLATGAVGTPLDLVCHAFGDPGCTPTAIVISPDGRTGYVAAAGSGDVMLLSLPRLSVAGVIQTEAYPDAIGLSGKWLYVANGASDTVSVFAGLAAPRNVRGVKYPFGVAIVPGARDAAPPGSAIVRSAPARPSGGRPAVRSHPTPFYGLPQN